MKEIEPEIWGVHKDFPSYKISNYGRVYNPETKKYLKGYLHKSRSSYYRRFALELSDGSSTKIMGHVLTIETFEERPPGKTQVDHLDGNTLNNRLNNLEFVDQPENIKRVHRRNKWP